MRMRCSIGSPLAAPRVASFLVLLLACPLYAAPPLSTRPVEGLRENTPRVHALTNLRIVSAPGQTLQRGTIVIRDGVIEAVGADVRPPADAKVWDLQGHTAYAGFIDALAQVELPSVAGRGTPYWNEQIRPELDVAELYQPDQNTNRRLRGQGITARLAAPSSGIIRGQSALVATGDKNAHESLLKRNVAQHLRLTVSRRGGSQYPNSPMGAVALARQAFYDAIWYRQVHEAYQDGRHAIRPEHNTALDVLQKLPHGLSLVIADAPNELFCLRADQFAREFGLRIVLHGSGYEYQRLDAIRALGRAIIVPLDFPKPPNVATPEAAMSASLDQMLHWDHAPENPARLFKAGIPIAFTTTGLQSADQFLTQIRLAVRRGLPAAEALRALTVAPAELFQVQDRLGTIAAGKAAHLVITNGNLFADETKVVTTWVDGTPYHVTPSVLVDPRATWDFSLDVDGTQRAAHLTISGTPEKLSGTLKIDGATTDAAAVEIKLDQLAASEARLSALFSSASLNRPGVAQLSAVLDVPDGEAATLTGQLSWPDGQKVDLSATRSQAPAAQSQSADAGDNEQANKDTTKSEGGNASKDDDSDDDNDDKVVSLQPASFPVQYPFGAFGRQQLPEQPADVLLQHATVWTCGPAGVLENASVLIHEGRIAAIGPDLPTPPQAVVIDAQGKHITPGIIDCHSHMATDGGVNESGQAVTAEVRIGDFIDPDDINIYRQLAGGVTTANILHGSANPIGGQNQVIKLRWGGLPEDLKLADAPAGIKFALGENVKRSNSHEPSTRYPQTRMGVEQLIRDELQAAVTYRQQWQQWQNNPSGVPPRRDLQQHAIMEILDGQRWIHCHSYRQDEILALLRVLEQFDVQIGTLQHILEGYKVADQMARHGAMASSFADWWAYKFEVYDAIPYNGALMHQAGIVVSFNSDDSELARHLNHEAAKAMKHGGVPAEEALKFVTLNPARQLRIDAHVGSLEVGKQADLVVWSGPPLSNLSRCEQTWIDGRKYFDRQEDAQLRATARQMRATLVQKILASGQTPRRAGEGREDPSLEWPREDLFCHEDEMAK